MPTPLVLLGHSAAFLYPDSYLHILYIENLSKEICQPFCSQQEESSVDAKEHMLEASC